MYFSDNRRGRELAKDPAVIKFKGRYLMYYSISPYGDGREQDGWGIGIAQSNDLEAWEIIGEIPATQTCEQKGFCAPGAIVLNDTVHLFYQTYGNFPKDAICHATSADGINFKKDITNPIFAPNGEWNNGRAIDADVIAYGDKLLLYFASRDPKGEVQLLGVAAADIESNFDKLSWKQVCNDTILSPKYEWEGKCIEAPAVCEYKGKLYMFYGGAYNNMPQQVGCAVSEDGINWVRLFEDPFLSNGKKGEWNESESGHPYIFVDDDLKYYLFYQGNNDNGATWYISKVEICFKEKIPSIKN